MYLLCDCVCRCTFLHLLTCTQTHLLGSTRSDTAYCVDCKITSCRIGEYVANVCNGTTTADDTVCTNCTINKIKQCDAGQYIHNACSGSGTQDLAECKTCSGHTCARGFFRPACNGSSHGLPPCQPCSVGSCPLVSLIIIC